MSHSSHGSLTTLASLAVLGLVGLAPTGASAMSLGANSIRIGPPMGHMSPFVNTLGGVRP